MAMIYSGCEDEPVGPNPPTGPQPPTENSNIIKGSIDTRTTLKNHLNGVDYEICGTVTVNADLIIEPGVEIVMCPSARLYIEQNGSLYAVGTSSSPIVFRGKNAAPGYWDLIRINSNDPDNKLKYVTISDGGGYSYYRNASIYVTKKYTGQLTLQNSVIRNSKGYGIEVENGASIPNFSSNTFSNNGNAPVRIPFSLIGTLDDSSNYGDGNYENYIYVSGSDMNQAQTVDKINVPYYIEGKGTINDDLKLNPGVQILMGPKASIYCESTGSFNAVGTSSDSIYIKGKVNSVGYWDLILMNSNNPLNKFSHVRISNGGQYSYYKHSSIYVPKKNTGSLEIIDSHISDSYAWGIYAESGSSITPSSAATIEAANTFNNNGTGPNAICTGNCNVYYP